MARMNFARSALAVTALAAAGLTHAATLRIAGANDILTFDPAGQNHQTTLAYQQMVYESLIRYDEKYQIVPSLATKWRPRNCASNCARASNFTMARPSPPTTWCSRSRAP